MSESEQVNQIVSESDNETEFFDACDSLDSKLESLNELQDTEQVIADDFSDNSDFESEKNDLIKKFDEKFNFNDKKKAEEKFVPLHERLNVEEKEKKQDEEEIEQEEEINTDPFYVNETELEKEQTSLTEQEKEAKFKQAQELKQSGNDLFKEGNFAEALELYTQALRCCPLEYKKERSIFYSNRSICYLKTKENLKCINESTKSIELDPTFIKPLLRRAECYQIEDKLDESLSDYKKLYELESKYLYKQKCFELEELIKERNEKLKTEMMGKLKDLGNMVLKPFGLSADNFQFVQDPSTGSYSVNFKQN